MNQPGMLRKVEPVDVQSYDGRAIEAAFLVFDDALGRTVRVYAARCLPRGGDRPAAIVVHCPGGGQTVQPRDLAWWAGHGFAAASFDWQIGDFPAHDPKRKSIWPEGVVSQGARAERIEQAVLPLAIEAAGVVIDWMQQADGVDGTAVGVTGISWGGYLTWAVNAHEPRVRAAAPVYGCGGLFEPGHAYAVPNRDLPDDVTRTWREQWDAGALAHRQIAPVCYLSSTNDFFGYHRFADRLLDQLTVPRRRSSYPNTNHHLGPGEATLGVRWFDHLLRGGPALPDEPALRDDLTVRADDREPIVARRVWWTASTGPDDFLCWRCDPPPDRRAVRHAFARVTYASGMTLNSPTRTFADATAPVSDGAVWPAGDSGVGFGWGLGSTQFYRTDLTFACDNGDTTRATWRIDRDGPGAMSFCFRGLSDPTWLPAAQADRLDAVAVGVAFDDDDAPDRVSVTIERIAEQDARQPHTTRLPLVDTPRGRAVVVRLRDFTDLPADVGWAQVRALHVQSDAAPPRHTLGPVWKMYP